MKADLFKHLSLALTFALGLVSCNGGTTNMAEGGIGGSGISMGTVTQYGSIFVNGVEYDTAGTKIIFADDGTEQTDNTGQQVRELLALGMVVTVRGSIDAGGVTGKASSVTYADILEGPIAATAATANSNKLTVLGQQVIIDTLTRDHSGNSLLAGPALQVDEWVEVSGFIDAQGTVHATYVAVKQPPLPQTLELKGRVGTINAAGGSFTIGALTVISSAANSLQPGDLVAVTGLAGNLTGNTLFAASVELRSALLDTEDHDEAEMEGIVSSSDPATSTFVLGGQSVSYSAATGFNGGTAAAIVPGARLEVEGSLSGGIFNADTISFEDGIELEANILDLQGSTLTLEGLGLAVELDEVLTALEGDGVSGLADLKRRQHVEIRARDIGAAGTQLLATKIAVSALSSAEIGLQGPLQAVNRPFVQLLGISVDTTGLTLQIEGVLDPVDPDTFFGAIQPDDLVSLEGSLVGGAPSWQKIELDN